MKKLVIIALLLQLLVGFAEASAGVVTQWAVSATASSEYSSPRWSAMQATGTPNTYPNYGDIDTAWSPRSSGSDPEWLELQYFPTRAIGVRVYETYNSGFVYKVDLIDVGGTYHTVWTGIDPTPPNQAGVFNIDFPETDYFVAGVKIYTQIDGWEEVDAVGLIGTVAATSTKYEYDELSRLTRVEYADGTVIKYTYDAAGNRTSQMVSPPNQPPNANAGPDRTVKEGDLVTLSGSGSDPDGNPLSFAWTQTGGPSVSLSKANTATPSFRAPFGKSTTLLTFQLTVSDGQASSSDAAVVTVQDLGASIHGTVKSSKSSAGAKVTVKGGKMGLRTTMTDATGFYEFLSLQPGSYIVTVMSPSLRSQTVRVSLAAKEDKVLDFTAGPLPR